MPRPPKTWSKNVGAVDHAKTLLHQAGIPLEVRVAKECQRFSRTHSTAGWSISSERIVYGDINESTPLREIDQCVSVYKEISPGAPFGLQVNIEVLIECKYRDGLVVFGYPEGRETSGPPIPVVSSLVGSLLLSNVDLNLTFPGAKLCVASLLHFEGSTPKGVHKENLIDNAGASLYDFVTYEIQLASASTGSEIDVLKDLGILEAFELAQSRSESHLYPMQWLATQPGSVFKKFNESAGLSENLYFAIWPLIPIVCVDAPIYVVTSDRQGEIGEFNQTKTLVTAVRTPGWHVRSQAVGAASGAEGPVFVVDVEGLRSVLLAISRWSRKIEQALISTSPAVRQRAPLEAALKEAVHPRSSYGAYRSDLGFF